jgi:hypothetical protein
VVKPSDVPACEASWNSERFRRIAFHLNQYLVPEKAELDNSWELPNHSLGDLDVRLGSHMFERIIETWIATNATLIFSTGEASCRPQQASFQRSE